MHELYSPFIFSAHPCLHAAFPAQALERQKEYTDAIRVERDELREEVVKLKDVLKVLRFQTGPPWFASRSANAHPLSVQKHGIVLGPDLSVNGNAGEAAESPGAEPSSHSAQDPQTPPTEGNSMLGKKTSRFLHCMASQAKSFTFADPPAPVSLSHLSLNVWFLSSRIFLTQIVLTFAQMILVMLCIFLKTKRNVEGFTSVSWDFFTCFSSKTFGSQVLKSLEICLNFLF